MPTAYYTPNCLQMQQKNANKLSHLVQLVFQKAFSVSFLVQVFFFDEAEVEKLLELAPLLKAQVLLFLLPLLVLLLLAALLASSLP